MYYYYDTCAIAKAFHIEDGSNVIENLLYNDISATYVSDLTYPEFYSTTFKKLRSKEILKEAIAIQVCRKFEMTMQYFNIVHVNKVVYTEGKNLIARLGSKYDLRTLDALHLAVYIQLAQLNKITLVSADNKLCNVAMELEYPVINLNVKSG